MTDRAVARRFLDVFGDGPVKLYDHAPPDGIDEANLVNGLVGRVRDNGLWARKKVNLWELIEVLYGRQRGDRVCDRYRHPLQPDIDLLCCETDEADERRTSPLLAAETKHFAHRRGDGAVLPKLADGSGFYAGLGQALSLLAMGIDYVYLTHFVHFHPDEWSGFGDDRDELIEAHRTVTGQYADSVARLIDGLELPIGYVAAGTRPVSDGIAAVPVRTVTPDRNPLRNGGTRVLQLLAESFNVV